MFEWLIIGGGIHGTVVANALLRFDQAKLEELHIVDPEPRPLEAWNRRIAQCGMRFLRSPAAHGVLPDFTSILRWGSEHGFERSDHTIPPYARPSVELFAAHSEAALEATNLRSRYCADKIILLEPTERCWVATGASGKRYQAKNVVLALGRGSSDSVLCVPDWADIRGSLPVYHVFAPTFSRAQIEQALRPVVIGGGVSAVHLALALSRNERQVTLLTRSKLRESQFDSDPCYIGPKCYERYVAIADPDERRRIIASVRKPGSIPPDLMVELNEARDRGEIRIVFDEIEAVTLGDRDQTAAGKPRNTGAGGDGRWMELRSRTSIYESDACVLATGFGAAPPGASLLREIERRIAGLRCVSDREMPTSVLQSGLRRDGTGHPIPTTSLEWAPGLYLTGILAEQELGPTAANIIGAHNSAKRIVSRTRGKPWQVPRSWKSYAPDTASSSSGVL